MLSLKRDNPPVDASPFGLAAAIVGAVFLSVLGATRDGPVSVRDCLAKGNYICAYDSALSEARDGSLSAANTIGNLYYLGLGVGQDFERAASWYARAAFEGYGPAQANLGHLFSQGLGVPKDMVRMFGWYKLAQLGGYQDVEDLLQRKTRDNQFNATLVERANQIFANLRMVKERYGSDFKNFNE